MTMTVIEPTLNREPLSAAERRYLVRAYSTCADWCMADHDASTPYEPETEPVEHHREIGQIGALWVSVVQAVNADGTTDVGVQVQQDGVHDPIPLEDVPDFVAGLTDLLQRAQAFAHEISA